MEIKNEIKNKIFAQYLGCRWRWDLLDNDILQLYITDLAEFERTEYKHNPKMVLNQLSDITDEDAIEVCRLIGMDKSHARFTPPAAIRMGKRMVNDLMTDFPKDKTEPLRVILIYSFLQSKGYDLPQYLLNGRTLYEVGLAIYK